MKNNVSFLLYDMLLGFFFVVCFSFLQWLQPSWFKRLEGIAYDFKLVHFIHPAPVSPANIQIIDIDEQSLKEIGRWPWPRSQLARLVDTLTAQGAIVISFDMLFSEPQQNPVEQVNKALQKRKRNYDFGDLIKELDNDVIFAKAISQNDVILGTLLQQNRGIVLGKMQAPAINQIATLVKNKDIINNNHQLHQFKGFNASIEKLNKAALGQGYINAVFDEDGFIRRTALISAYKDTIYPSLALETFRAYSFAPNITPIWHVENNSVLLSGLAIGTSIIRTDNRAQMLIPFRGGIKRYSYTSATAVMNEKVVDKRFEGAVVFIGSSAVGMADLRTTPVSLLYPGVEVHATVFDALVQPENQVVQPEWWLGANILLILILGLWLSYILIEKSPVAMLMIAASVLGAVWAANVYIWHVYQIHLPIIALLLVLFVISITAIMKGFYQENLQRKHVKDIFGQYVPPAHIDELLNDTNASSMDGERKEMTVLFADIRNFTHLSEGLNANELKQLLNDYLSPITEVIFKHGGTIDKYVGDMVMAFWGAPLNDAMHAEHAVNAAFDMLTKTAQLSNEFKQRGLPAIAIGIGINTGMMNVGDMGSSFRRAYTVLGDAVNLGSRLESLTKYYGVDMLISETTLMQCSSYHFHFVDKVKVVGKDKTTNLYMPIKKPINESQLQQADYFEQCFLCYTNKDFTKSMAIIDKLLQLAPKCKLYLLFKKRLQVLLQKPPSTDWDGSFTHTNK